MAKLPPALSQAQNKVESESTSGSKLLKSVFGGSVSEKIVIDFTRSFAVMIKARLSLIQALETAIEQQTNAAFKKILTDVRKKVKAGYSLAESLSDHPKVFDTFYIHLVKIGELAGILGDVLLRLSDYMQKRHTLKKKVKMAMIYPGMILGVATGAMLFLLLVMVPTFADMYRDFDAELPELTQFVLSISEWITNYIWIIIAVGILIAVIFKYAIQNAKVRYFVDRIKLKIPFLGTILVENIVIRFCETLGTLLESGVTMVDGLSLINKSSKNLLVKNATTDMLKTIKKGGSLGNAIKNNQVFPPVVLQMISVGEETAELDRMLLHVADHFRNEVDLKVQNLTSIIEPLLIIILGIILGFLIVAMYLPMFELMNVVG